MKYISVKTTYSSDIFYYQIDKNNRKAWRILYKDFEPCLGFIWETFNYVSITNWMKINKQHKVLTSLPFFVKPNHLAPQDISMRAKLIRAF